MLLSIAYILLLGMLTGYLCKRCHIPSLTGMMLTGIVLGPHVFNVIDASLLDSSSDLRRIALLIILIRAGLSLQIDDLKKVGRPAIFMCFVPACFEMIGMVLLAPPLLGISVIDAAILGAVVGAVSPAVIVPKMLKLMEEGYGCDKHIPQLILAGASIDDVFVIVMFTAFTGLAQGNALSFQSFLTIPLSLLIGILVGVLLGYGFALFCKRVHIRDTSKVLILLCIAFLLVSFEDTNMIPFASLISVMVIGITLQKKRAVVANRLSIKFNKLWVVSEIVLFVLVGASVNLSYALSQGFTPILLLIGALSFRMVGVWVCLLHTKLIAKERFFCMIAYSPKATVQAAIGGIPLAMGLACGNIVLTIAVIAILLTAPIGAFLIDISYKHLLQKHDNQY